MGWYIAEDTRLPLKCNLFNAVTTCFLYFKQCPRQLLKDFEVIQWSSQQMRDWQIRSGLYGYCIWPNSSIPSCLANQAATIRGLEKLSSMYEYPYQIAVIRGHISKVMMCKTVLKNMTMDEGSIFPVNLQAAGLMVSRILKQYTTLLNWSNHHGWVD